MRMTTEAEYLDAIRKQLTNNTTLRLRGSGKRTVKINGVDKEFGGPISIKFGGPRPDLPSCDKLTGGRLFVFLFTEHREYRSVYDTDENEERVRAYPPRYNDETSEESPDPARREIERGLSSGDMPAHDRYLMLFARVLWYGCFTEAERLSFLQSVVDSIIGT